MTYVVEINKLIEYLKKKAEDGYRFAVVSFEKSGSFTTPTKRKKYYQVGFAFAGDLFEKENLRLFFDNPVGVFLLLKDESLLNSEIREEIKRVHEEV